MGEGAAPGPEASAVVGSPLELRSGLVTGRKGPSGGHQESLCCPSQCDSQSAPLTFPIQTSGLDGCCRLPLILSPPLVPIIHPPLLSSEASGA